MSSCILGELIHGFDVEGLGKSDARHTARVENSLEGELLLVQGKLGEKVGKPGGYTLESSGSKKPTVSFAATTRMSSCSVGTLDFSLNSCERSEDSDPCSFEIWIFLNVFTRSCSFRASCFLPSFVPIFLSLLRYTVCTVLVLYP